MDHSVVSARDNGDWGPLSALPGNPLMWVLIASELAVFGLALLGYAGARTRDPSPSPPAQDHLDRLAGVANTALLLTSGFFAALANQASREGRQRSARAPCWRRPARSASAFSSSRARICRRDRRRPRHRLIPILHPLFSGDRLPCPACRARPDHPRHRRAVATAGSGRDRDRLLAHGRSDLAGGLPLLLPDEVSHARDRHPAFTWADL